VIFEPRSRRQFLAGAGKLLALPFLPSLLPRSAAAQNTGAPVVRLVQFANAFSATADLFWGGLTTDNRIAPNVNVRDLSSVSGPLSPIFGSAFDPLRSKLSLLRGLDVLAVNPNHNYTFAGCASSYDAGLDGDEYAPLSNQPSFDVLISRSSKVYGPGVPAAQQRLTLNPMATDDYSNNRSFSWQPSGGSEQIIRPTKQTQALMDTFASGFGQLVPGDASEKSMVHSVWSDFKAVRDGARISSDDRTRLDAYLALVSDIETSISVQPTVSCPAPMQQQENGIDATVDNQLRILAAALACGLTRVATVTLGMSEGYGTRHPEHHALASDPNSGSYGIVADLKQFGVWIARFLSMLDGLSDAGGGTVLDNSVVSWTMQYGVCQVSSQHCAEDMPVMLAGKGGGTLKPGSFVDLRLEGGTAGLPYNNYLVTLMNCMGLSSGDYESTQGSGYGWYGSSDLSGRPGGSQLGTNAGRRAPLPYVYVGPARG
jgi:hypothetical protein